MSKDDPDPPQTDPPNTEGTNGRLALNTTQGTLRSSPDGGETQERLRVFGANTAYLDNPEAGYAELRTIITNAAPNFPGGTPRDPNFWANMEAFDIEDLQTLAKHYATHWRDGVVLARFKRSPDDEHHVKNPRQKDGKYEIDIEIPAAKLCADEGGDN